MNMDTNTTYIDVIISVIIAFAIVLIVTIIINASVIVSLLVIPCIFCGTGFVLSYLIDYRNRVDNG